MSQLAFHWPTAATYAPDDFIIADANAQAVALIDSWPAPQASAVLLTGPTASGKTHLVHRWMARTRGVLIDSTLLGHIASEDHWNHQRYAALENIESITDETALFHLLRHAESSQCHLLLTSRLLAAELPFQLPDLRSRLLALPMADIKQPDEDMLQSFFLKAFADRQWRTSPAVIQYIITHTDRSFLAAYELIEKIEILIRTTKRELTIPAIKPLIETLN